MKRSCGFDRDTEEYLRTYERILNNMIREMKQAKLTDSISHNFIVQMIPHHRAAIEMSQNILSYTKDERISEIASNIICEQTKSIENMREIESSCAAVKNCSGELCMYQRRMNQILRIMFSRMKNACTGGRVDCDFMWEMIPHHRGAVEMAAGTLEYGICPELEPILFAIISSQKRGIGEMQELLKCLGC